MAGVSRGLSRRGLLLGAAAAAVLAGCTRVSIPRPTASPTGAIRSQLDEVVGYVTGGSNRVGVALHDLRSGADWGFNPDYASQSASMAKPMIVLMAQRKARAEGAPLDPPRVEQAIAALVRSDNDAADALWTYAGGPDAYDDLAELLELPHTHRDPGKDFWSWTWTTPTDQVLLVERIMGSEELVDADRAFVYSYMGRVQDDQRWGVGAAESGSVAAHLKNGWVQFESSDGLWAVNSMGHVAGDGRDYRLAVMTRTPTFDEGRELTSEIGRQVFSVLGSGLLEAA